MLLDGRRILITGAARGIGLAAARQCLAEGARVFLTDVDAEALAEAAEGLSAPGDRLRPVPLDVSDRASIGAALSRIEDWAGLDGVVNNAAILDISHAADVPEDRWSRVLDVNLTGALRVTQGGAALATPIKVAGNRPTRSRRRRSSAFHNRPPMRPPRAACSC